MITRRIDMNATTPGKIIWFARTILWLLFFFEVLALLGVVRPATMALTWSWLGYTVAAYLILLEVPLFLIRHQPKYQGAFDLLAIILTINYIFDAVGNVLNLYERIPMYDQLLHTTTFPWLLAAFCLSLGHMLQQTYDLPRVPLLLPAFIILAAMFLSVVHEFIELAIDIATNSNAGTGATDIHDTTFDLVGNLVGLVIFAGAWIMYERRKPIG